MKFCLCYVLLSTLNLLNVLVFLRPKDMVVIQREHFTENGGPRWLCKQNFLL